MRNRKRFQVILTAVCLMFAVDSTFAQDFWQPTNGHYGGSIPSLAISAGGDIYAGTFGGVFRSLESTTAVEGISTSIPSSFALEQNYPNPFNPGTTIRFSLPHSSAVMLKICNIIGREVATVATESLAAGQHKVNWNAGGLANGVYYYRLQAGDFVATRKLTLLK